MLMPGTATRPTTKKEDPASRVEGSERPPDAAASEARASTTPPMLTKQEDDPKDPTQR